MPGKFIFLEGVENVLGFRYGREMPFCSQPGRTGTD